MSLNGLDEPQVKEAYEAAAAEPGGWFLLKYSSRDEVDLLGRGNGGIVEMRNNISQYEESSPLFGFLKYRRRNVLIRYLPEDCSRLVQARVTVHFNALCEKYTPYHTTFSITTAKELKDSKLSAACSLHAASGSTSSSTSSLRRRRLMEIAEEEEEEQQQRATKRSSTVLEDGNDEKENEENEDDAKTPPASPSPVTLNAELASSPENSKFVASEDPPDFMGADRPTSSQTVDDGRRLSSQTLRPELYSYATYTYGKPKVKLGPRPSLDVGGHPNPVNGNFRPVSQMPTGFKTYSKGSKRVKPNDEKSLAESALEASDIPFAPASIPIPDTPSDASRPQSSSGARPVTSSGASHKSPTMSTFSASAKHAMTPEKARLMKAMKLREKKKNQSKQVAADASSPRSTDDATSPTSSNPPQSPEKPEEEQNIEHHLETLTEEEEKRLSQAKLDSSIAVDASVESPPTEPTESTEPTDPSESARSDSRPASPLVPSSEPEPSTKASSVSESTDETVKDGEGERDTDGSKNETTEDTAQATLDAGPVATPEPEQDKETEATEAPDTQDDVEETVVEAKEETTEEPNTPTTAKAEPEVDGETVQEIQEEIQEAVQQATRLETNALESASPEDPEPAISEETPAAEQPVEKENIVSAAVSEETKDTIDSPPSPDLAIPKSKFSASNPGSPTATAFSLPTIAPPLPDDAAEQVLSASVAEETKTPTLSTPPSSGKRKPIEPIRTDLTPSEDQSQAHLSDDDELLDELQSATVQEARPMTVSKSPLSPVFPDSSAEPTETEKESPHAVRTISNPIRGNLLAPSDVSQSSARSVSAGAAYLHKITQQQTTSRENLIPKNGKLGSKISQRIKALEQLSSHPSENPPPSRSQSTRSNAPSATFFSVNKSREPSRSPSVADRASSLTRGSPHRGAAVESREGSPEVRVPRERSGSVASRLSMFEPPMPSLDSMPRGRPESISVTARILRDPSQGDHQPELLRDPSEFNKLELKQSPLEVNHQLADPLEPSQPESPPKETIRERRMSKEKRRSQSENRDDEGNSRRRSLSIVRDFIKDRRKSITSSSTEALAPPVSSAKGSPSRPPSTHNNNSGSSITRRLSISSRRSSISKDATAGALSPSMTEASGSGDDSKSTKSDKMKSRAGRFMRRLSSSMSSGRKNLTPTALSPTLHEEEQNAENAVDMRGVSRGSSLVPPASTVQFFGDVNVQFPDNLLWKRRTLGLDTQGFLILSATPSAATPRDRPATATTGIKRYHLSEFRGPYMPDVEIQELPNSVVLDFVEGSGIQLACEDRAGQKELLNILHDAHQSHATFGQ